MESDFGATLAAWSDFYGSVAGVAATLVGLLFVGLALNPKIMDSRRLTGLNAWTGQTFHSFLVILVLALIAQIPDTTRRTLLVALAFVGIQGIARLVHDVRRVRASDDDPRWRSKWALRRFAIPATAYALCLGIAGALVLEYDDDALGWLVVVLLFLMVDAAGNCWDLLKEIGQDQP